MDAALVLVRLLAFAAGAALFGAPLFALYGQVAPRRLEALVAASAVLTTVAAAAALVVQTGQMAGDPRAGLDPSTLRDAIACGGFGMSILARAGAGLGGLVLGLALRPGRALWLADAAFGAVALGALAWSGHGAADEGAAGVVHLISDIAHLLAAGVWVGALAVLLLLLWARRPQAAASQALHRALVRFSGVGSGAVGVILASGLSNSWFLVGPGHIADLTRTLWGRLLLVKIAIFLAMLGLAALNRWRLTPRFGATLAGRPDAALAALRRSVALESALAVAVLALVAVLGTQPPPTAA